MHLIVQMEKVAYVEQGVSEAALVRSAFVQECSISSWWSLMVQTPLSLTSCSRSAWLQETAFYSLSV